MKKTGTTLMVVGAALTIGDKLTGGRLFGAGGILAGVNSALPQFPLPIVGQSDLGIWLIAVGALMRFVL